MNENISLKEMKIFLDSHSIPEAKKWKKTFLAIAKQPHYENVISNIYAFYFKQWEEHGFKNLFEKSLKQVIESKTEGKTQFSKNFYDMTEFVNLNSETEVAVPYYDKETKKTTHKFIDILLDNGTHAIIIENKIYHHLNNPLEVYWNHPEYPDENKRGVVLTLKPTYSNNNNFVYITHIELIDSVMSNIGTYLPDCSDKYLVFLNDFYQNILNLSRNIMTTEEVKFYYDNQSKIDQVAKYRNNLKEHLIKEIEKAGEQVEGLMLNIPSRKDLKVRVRYYDSELTPDICIAVLFHDIMNKPQIFSLVAELKGDLTHKEYRPLFSKVGLDDRNNKITDPMFDNLEQTGYLHFYRKDYNASEFENTTLHEFIQNKLVEDKFIKVIKGLESVVKDNKLL